ncbi:uncharacterized protein LOC114535761 [Dendronephthya gigantea]|uniref:uncharacterized protein LOC114535761 n=1 Tax=Dendronephthya gigantea TaxID=151771 RepID=UPI00106D2FE6|nr:uncharacterized protein LOC114535761 [Dendronephthya gigantea]
MLRLKTHSSTSSNHMHLTPLAVNIIVVKKMQESQAIKNGRTYLENKRRIMLGISPGNPFFYEKGNLVKMLQIAKDNSNDKIMMFIADKISEHNYRAVGSKNPEKSARVKANRLRHKCEEAIRSCQMQDDSVEYINWVRDVESSSHYVDALKYVKHLYEVNDQFQKDVKECTQPALVSMKHGRERSMPEGSDAAIDLDEGVKYPLKELAFFSVIRDIYEGCEEFVFVYHRPWSVLEKYFDGGYDNVSRPSLGFYVFE